MKNFITLALLIGFATLTFTACGDKEDSGDTGTEQVQEEETDEAEGGDAGDSGDAGEGGDTGEAGEGDTGDAGEEDAGVDADVGVSYLEFPPMYVTIILPEAIAKL